MKPKTPKEQVLAIRKRAFCCKIWTTKCHLTSSGTRYESSKSYGVYIYPTAKNPIGIGATKALAWANALASTKGRKP